MPKTHFALIGSGGLAREVMSWAPAVVKAHLGDDDIQFCFAQSEPAEAATVNGISCIALGDFSRLSGRKYFNIAFSNSFGREKVSKQLMNVAAPLSLVAPNAMVGPFNEIGEGALISPFSCIQADVKIGRFFHANVFSYVAHDCVIGDFVTFAPKVCCNGAVCVGNHAYIGAGATIKQGTKQKPLAIGAGAIVGMGAVVTKTVDNHATVVGNPARTVSREPSHG